MKILVTGMGMTTAIGRTADAACAAIRAGIGRPLALTELHVDEDTDEELALTGHPVPHVDGFTSLGRWLALAVEALHDLAVTAPLPSLQDAGFWGRTALIAVTSFVETTEPLTGRDAAIMTHATDLAALAHLPVDPRLQFVVGAGNAGVADALEFTAALFSRLQAERALIVAADSLVDEVLLRWLAESGRLKTSDAPTGLIPGEAGVALLIESDSAARRRVATPLASVAAVAVGTEPQNLLVGEKSTGVELAACMQEALKRSEAPVFRGDVICDLNGETWRANEWGTALVRLGGSFDPTDTWTPASSLGDTGAASGGVGVCLAVHALLHQRTPGPLVCVVSSSASGQVGCVTIRAEAREDGSRGSVKR